MTRLEVFNTTYEVKKKLELCDGQAFYRLAFNMTIVLLINPPGTTGV